MEKSVICNATNFNLIDAENKIFNWCSNVNKEYSQLVKVICDNRNSRDLRFKALERLPMIVDIFDVIQQEIERYYMKKNS